MFSPVVVLLLLAGLLLLGLLASPARAETFTVTNTNDGGAGSLRQAILEANANRQDDTIDISATGTINLQSALPNLSTNMEIEGPGAEALTVRQDTRAFRNFRIFTVRSGATVSISGLTIADGRVFGNPVGESNDGFGGGIANNGTLTLTDSIVMGNSVTGIDGGSGADSGHGFGGGIYNRGTLTLEGSTMSGNSTTGSSGGHKQHYKRQLRKRRSQWR